MPDTAKSQHTHLYEKAFALFKKDRTEESIAEFKRIREEDGDPRGICPTMIALLYYYELEDHESALPFAREATRLKPNSEKASICLVHRLRTINAHTEVNEEVRRYLETGSDLDLYQTLFEENGVSADDFA